MILAFLLNILKVSPTHIQLPFAFIVASVGKGDLTLELQIDNSLSGKGGAKINKFTDNIEIINIGCNLIESWYDVNFVVVKWKLMMFSFLKKKKKKKCVFYFKKNAILCLFLKNALPSI